MNVPSFQSDRPSIGNCSARSYNKNQDNQNLLGAGVSQSAMHAIWWRVFRSSDQCRHVASNLQNSRH
eukprot:2120780-Pleurochrysis_carterae.AAC.2